MEAAKLWEKLRNTGEIYSARTGHTAVSAGPCIYLFGGTDGTSRQQDLYVFDPAANNWTKLVTEGTPPAARSGSQAASIENDLYFFGGYTKKDGEYYSDLFKYSITQNTWTEVRTNLPWPSARTDHSLVSYGACLYVLGGFDGRERYNDLWEYSAATNVWRCIESDPSPDRRFGHTAVVCRDKMIILGGWNGHETLNDVWSYSFLAGKWTRVLSSGFIAPRYRHSAIACGTSIFVFGGVNKDQVRFSDVYELNLNLRYWTRVETEGTAPSPRTFHRALLYEGYMYVLGGFDGSRKNDMYRLYLQDLSPEEDIERNPLTQMKPAQGDEPFNWQQIQPQGLNYTQRTGHSAVGLGGFFYVFGGTDEQNRRDDLFRYDVEKRSWAMLPATGDKPKPRSGARGVAYGQMLYFFGGYTKKDGEYFNDLHSFHIASLEWKKIDPPGQQPAARTDHTVVQYESSLYVFGGYDGKNRFNDLWQFDFEDLQWRLLSTKGSAPITRFGHSACVLDHCMYIFGGWDGHETLDDLYQFSFASGIWMELRHLAGMRPNPRYRHTCVSFSGSLYVFGGVDRAQTRYNDLHEFVVDRKEWNICRTTGQLPSARTFHRAVLQDDSMYILGGFDGKSQNDLFVIKLRRAERGNSRPSSSFSRLRDLEEDENEGEDVVRSLRKQNEILKQQIQELSQRLEKEEERDMCRICYEREIDTVLLDCAHRVMCFRCASNIHQCPVCRQDIARVLKTYQAY